MGLTGCYAAMKLVICLFNLIFWVTGLGVIILSLWMITDPTFYVSIAQDESSYYSGVYLLLAVGILLFIVGFLGCCGTMKESLVMLILFSCALLLILVAEISAAAWAYANSDQLKELVKDSVQMTVRDEYGVLISRTTTFDAIQQGLMCCGADRPEDWQGTKYNNIAEKLSVAISSDPKPYKIPTSCCSVDHNDPECRNSILVKSGGKVDSGTIYMEGCTNKLLKTLEDYMEIVIGCVAIIGIAQLLGVIFALILCCAIQQRDRYKI